MRPAPSTSRVGSRGGDGWLPVARRWWVLWASVNVVVLVAGLDRQLAVLTEPCAGCPSVFRLTPAQVVELEAAGGTLLQYQVLVGAVVVVFAAVAGHLAWVLNLPPC